MKTKLKNNKWAVTFLTIVLVSIVCRLVAPPLLSDVSFSQEVYDKNHKLLRITLSEDDKYRIRSGLSEVSPQLIEAILLKEDKYFYYHFGFNPVSLVKAFWKTYVRKSRKIGASTITMQVARLYYKLDTKTVPGKILQIMYAVKLELQYSKDEILEAYLNLLPYGRNIEGVKAACLIYYNKSPYSINLTEVLTLCVIPQSPIKRILNKKIHSDLYSARLAFFYKWLNEHPEDKRLIKNLNLPIVQKKIWFPFLAPHFVDSVLCQNDKAAIITTLDYNLQTKLNRCVKSYIDRRKIMGIKNAAALLLDYKNMEIKAMIGSADFFSDEINGQVNGTLAPRSPGSTLKPFVYALGFDQGIIHSHSLLKDTSTDFAHFTPENYDGEFRGPVLVKDALNLSRNIPAVNVALQLKDPALYEFLRNAGINDLKGEEHYGLALVLGGKEMTMHELVKLYAMLANGGVVRPIKNVKNQFEKTNSSIKKLLSPEASFITLEILKEKKPPGKFVHLSSDLYPIAWKTGTASKFRDAWAVSVFNDYVLAVWIGDFDGACNPAFVGYTAAAPLMFEIIESIKQTKTGQAPFVFNHEVSVKKIDVCAVSGNIPGPFCKHKMKALFIPGRSPITVCKIHRKVFLDNQGYRLCGEGKKSSRSEIYEFWPSDLLRLFKQAGIPRRVPPAYAPDCSMDNRNDNGIPPAVLSPNKDVIYVMRNNSEKNRIALLASVDSGVKEVFWFCDQSLLGRTEPSKPFFWAAKPGRFLLRVVDDVGRSDEVVISVNISE